MPPNRVILIVVALGAALLLSGCQTICREKETFPRDAGMDFSLGSDEAALAQALANFGMGILSDGTPDCDPTVYYARALELQPDSVRSYAGMAAYHARKGERDAAIGILKKCCEANPSSVDARLYLAQYCQSFNQMDEALAAALQSVRLAPRDHRTYLTLASVRIAMGNTAGAIEALEDALLKVDNPLPLFRCLGDIHAQSIQSSEPSLAEQHLDQAVFHYVAAAQQPYDSLTPVYLHRLGDLYIMKQDVQRAIDTFEQLTIYQPDNLEVRKKLALCYMALNEKEKAVLALKKISEGEPDNSEVYYYMGEIYEAMEDRENAMKYYSLAAEAPGGNPLPYLKLAGLYLESDPEKAGMTLAEGLKRMPDNIQLLSMLTRVYLLKRQMGEAINTFERMSEIAGNSKVYFILDPVLYLNFGVAAKNMLQTEKATAFFKKGLEAHPSSIELRVNLAFLLIDEGKKEQAIEIMEKAASAMPDNPVVHFYMGTLYHHAGLFDKAVQSFRTLAEIAEREPRVVLDSAYFFSYGAALERCGDRESAQAMFIRALDLDSENALTFNYLAYMWAEAGENLDLALEYVTHALDLDPDNPAFIDTLAWICFKKGRYDLALDHIENALFFLPDDSIVSEHMGDILNALGRQEEAIRWWIYSLRLDPSNESVKNTLRNHTDVNPDELLREPEPEQQ